MSPAATRVLNDLNLVNNANEFNYIKEIIDVKIQALKINQKQGSGVGTNTNLQQQPQQQQTPNPAVSSANPVATGNRASVDTGRFTASKKVKEKIKDNDEKNDLKDYFKREQRD